MRRISLPIILVFMAFSGFSAGPTIYTGTFLLEDTGSRSAGLSGACASLSGDPSFIRYNPASAAGIETSQLDFLYFGGGMADVNCGSATYTQRSGPGVLGLSLFYYNGGVLDLNFLDGTTKNVIAEQDVTASLSYGVNFWRKIDIGATVKVIYSGLIDTPGAFSASADFGILLRDFPFFDVNLGLSIVNLNSGIKYLDTVELLPEFISGGLSFSFTPVEGVNAVICGDAIYDPNSQGFSFAAGFEMSYSVIMLRFGVPIQSAGDHSFTAGFTSVMGNYKLEYAASFGNSLGVSHRLGVVIDLKHDRLF